MYYPFIQCGQLDIWTMVTHNYEENAMSNAIDRLNAIQAQLPAAAFEGRLSFPEKCAAYYLIRRGFKQSTLCLAFGVTPVTISRLAKAGGDRYADVMREYSKLGHEAFGVRYYTDDIETRLARWLVNAPSDEDKARRKFGPNPAARSAAGEYLIRAFDGSEITFFVYWLDGEGWTFRQEQEPHPFVSKARLFASSAARKAALDNYAIGAEDILNFIPEIK
jgi:hypothetical protein